MNTTQLELINKLNSGPNPRELDNFETQSHGSIFFNQEDMNNYEECIQDKINDIWNSIQEQQEQVQTEFQDEYERIIEEAAQMKFEKIAEIKLMFKDCTSDMESERERALADVKREMEDFKS